MSNDRLSKIITVCIFSTLFFSSHILFKEPFEFYVPYLFVIILFPFLMIKNPFPTKIFTLFFLLLFTGIIGVLAGNNTYPFFFKIFINIIISVLFYYYIFQSYKLDVNKLFSYYMKGVLIVCVIGLIQFVSYHINFKYGYDYKLLGLNKWGGISLGGLGIRINSIFSEPSFLAGAVGPAFFVSLHNLLTKSNNFISQKQSVLIILIYLLTFSTVAYLGVFVTLILLLINWGFVRYALIFGPIIIGSYFYLYTNVEEFRMRIDGLDELYSGTAKSSFEVHGSSFVQYNNSHITTENFKRNLLFGTGLGSYSIAYDRYSLVKEYGGINDFNKADGNSMFFRLTTETGLIGIVFIFLFIIKFFILKKNDHSGNDIWLISNAVLVAIFLQLFRQGNYTYNGFMFYMWMYYYAKQSVNNKSVEINADKKKSPVPLH